MLLVANPGPQDHWISQRFGCVPEYLGKRTRDRARVHVSLLDNAEYLPIDYVRSMLATKDTRPDFYKRMVLGLWGAFGGRRFKVFDPGLHVVQPFDVDDGWEKVGGLDWGYKNPFCYLNIAITYEGRWLVVGEHYAAEQRISEHATAIKRIEQNKDAYLGFQGNLSPSARWLDPTAFNRLREETESHAFSLAENEIYCSKAQNDRLAGWNRIDELLAERLGDNLPRLQIFSTCRNLIRELPNLQLKPGTDDVDKVNDHAPDALRYAVSSRTPTPVEQQFKTPEEAHTREEVIARIVARAKEREDPPYTEVGMGNIRAR